jgi:hypothetical protein
MGFGSDPYVEHYKRALEGKKKLIEQLANRFLSLLHVAKDPNSKQNFKDACAQLRQAIGETQGLFDPNAPIAILAKMDNAVLQIEKTPENFNYIIQLADLMQQVPNIPYDQGSLEDEVKKLVDQKEPQDKIDQLRDELTRLVEDHSDDVQHRLMTEIQRLGDVLHQARRKSLLEVIATSGGIMILAGTAVDIYTGTPVGSILSGIVQTASDINSSANDRLNERLRSYLDELNVRMPKGRTIMDKSLALPKLSGS